MLEPPQQPSNRLAFLGLLLALIGGASMAGYHLGCYIPRMLAVRAYYGGGGGYSFGDDFYPIWLTTREWRLERVDLYGMEMTHKIQTGLFGHPLNPNNPKNPPPDYRQFAYPAFTDLILWPFALFSFPTLRVLLAVLLPVLTAISIHFWLQALDWKISWMSFVSIVVLSLGTYELLEALFALQPGLLVGFLLSGAALALKRGRLLLAGILMSLTLIKPQMTLLAILYFLLWSLSDRRRTRFAIGFFFITLCLSAAALFLWPHWIGEWLGILRGYHRYAQPPLISVLLGPHLDPLVGPVIIAIALLISLRLAWRARKESPESPAFWWTLSLLLAISSVTLLPGQAIYDHVILIPGILLLVRHRTALRNAGLVSRTLVTAGALVLAWPWFSAFVLLTIRAFTPAVFQSPNIFVLPIRTAASLPFAVLALLGYGVRISQRPMPATA